MSASQNLKVTWKNVPTRTITAGGVEFAYRELGTNNPATICGAGNLLPSSRSSQFTNHLTDAGWDCSGSVSSSRLRHAVGEIVERKSLGNIGREQRRDLLSLLALVGVMTLCH